jgi:hypothetical protein
MPMVVMAPAVVVPVAEVANAARAVMGPDHPAGAVRVVRGVVIVRRTIDEMPAEMLVVPEREAAMAKAAAVEHMRGAIPAAAMEHRAAGVKTTAVETTAVTSVTAAPSMTTAAMTAADFGGEPVGNLFRRGCGTRIDQRERFRALAGCSGQQQYRGGRKTEATDKAAPGICNFHHL